MSSSHDMSISSHVLDIMKCAICLDMPTEPKLLPCAHVFCLSCLEGHMTALGDIYPRTLKCPQCRRVSNLPIGGVRALVTDYRALQLGEILQQHRKAKASNRADEHSLDINLDDSTDSRDNEPTLDPDSVTNLARQLHGLLRFNLREARNLLDNQSRPDRSLIVSEMVGSNTALTIAIESGSVEAVEYLIEQCDCDVEQPCEGIISSSTSMRTTRSPPILKAVHSKNLQVVQCLLAHGANVNAQDSEGWTSLHLASRKSSLEMLQCLLDAGADTNLQDELGITCLMTAKRRPNIRSYLLSSGANPNLANVHGGTALFYAVSEGCEESSKALLEHGADSTVTGIDGNTVLHSAVTEGHEPIVQMLLDHGADPYARNGKNEDCFLLATILDRHLIMKCLMRKHRADFYS